MIGQALAQSRDSIARDPTARDSTARDFTIPPPSSAPSPAPGVAAAPAPGSLAPSPFAGLTRGADTVEVVLGAGALLVLAVAFLFVRQGVRAHLIGRRAALDAANGASSMLYAALVLTASVLVTATVGRLWSEWLGLGAMLALCAVLFAVAAVLFVRAPARRR